MSVMGMAVPGQSAHSWGYLTYRYVLQRDRPASVAREVDNSHAGLVKCAMLTFKPGYKITSNRVRHKYYKEQAAPVGEIAKVERQAAALVKTSVRYRNITATTWVTL